jgi:uncharacterized membrane protein YoaT (DUF817 family)
MRDFLTNFLTEFLIFGWKEARACVFAGSFFVVLIASRYVPLGGLPRYDFIFLAAIAIQIVLLATRIESGREAVVLCLFHAIGLILELYKTHPSVGSWSYPEPGYLKIGTVPLYSGFMYAAVASYMCQAWRIFDLQLDRYPEYWLSGPLCAAIYINFFTNRYFQDLRFVLIPAVFAVFWRTRVGFTVWRGRRRHMPLVLSFALIGFFIWVAENIATFFGAWVYPEQTARWTAVSFQKFSSWFLLVIISFLIVADLKHVRERRSRAVKGPSAS